MNHPLRIAMLLLGGVCGSACDTSSDLASTLPPPTGYPLAYVMHDCAPWDGPALAIVLTAHRLDSLETAYPLLRVVIYSRGGSMAGRSYRWPSDPTMAVGTRCSSADSCEAATAGQITLAAVRTDTMVEGGVQLHFATGERISGGFRAMWLPRPVMCG